MNHKNEIILLQPEIPQNTGNIVRTCKATETPLRLIKPLGFHFEDKKLRRAGLDYWTDVDIEILDQTQFEQLVETSSRPCYFFTSKSKRSFWDVDYTGGAHLIFGSETRGFPPHYYEKYCNNLVTIPMATRARCLNLSNAVAVALYEAIRKSSQLT